MATTETSFYRLVERAAALSGTGPRRVLAITGPPGAGKTTLADALADSLGPAAVVVGMDGYHLAGAELARLGRTARKGAIDTFDADGYVSLLGRLRAAGPRPIYAPRFERTRDEAVGGAVAVDPDVRLVITEGNYLLADQPPWDQVRGLVDEVWYCVVDDSVRTERLVGRHERYGRGGADARRLAYGNDSDNARLVALTAERADLLVTAASIPGPRAA